MKRSLPEESVTVVFRKWPNGGILALFPNEVYVGVSCMAYEHVGQHGGADYNSCIARTKPTSPKEYHALKEELESIGYNLTVRKRWTRRR